MGQPQQMSIRQGLGSFSARANSNSFGWAQPTSFQPQQPLPGPWLADETRVPEKPFQSFNRPAQKQTFWSSEDTILKREQAAQHLCHLKEELLEQRITFVENILFRSMDLPAHDVRYAAKLVEEEKEKKEEKKKDREDKHMHDFQRHYVGPFPECTVKNPENGFFVDTLRAVRDHEIHEERAQEHERYRKTHALMCALSGDWHYLKEGHL